MNRRSQSGGLFASGPGLRLRGDSDGGALVLEGAEYIREMVLSSLLGQNSDNPFQDLGAPPVFGRVTDSAWRMEVRNHVISNFETLERNNLAKLVAVNFGNDAPGGELIVKISYINLETNSQSEASTSADFGSGALDVEL